MLMNRIMGALTFKSQVYGEVEKDKSFTTTAWAIVAVVAFVNQLVLYLSDASAGIIGLVLGTVIGVAAFAVGAFVIAWVGKSLFKADVSFEEIVRAVGLAEVWGIFGVLGLLGSFALPLTCLVSLLTLVSFFIAAKEALDLEWAQTVVTVVIGYFVILVVVAVIGGFVGLGAGVAGTLLNQ